MADIHNASKTSILKVLLKQYKSPTGLSKFSRVLLLQKQIKGAKMIPDLSYVDSN